MRALALLVTAVISMVPAAPWPAAHSATPASASFALLEADLEQLREVLGIPGMSAAVVEDERIVWSTGFGFADVENQVAAVATTPYGLASVTKPVAAALVMQLVDEGLIDLDASLADYGISVVEGAAVTVRHLLNHTSEGVPGAVHSYNGNRYGLLGGVIEHATGRSFAKELGDRVLVPLDMSDTALNPLNAWESSSVKGFEEFKRGIGWGGAFDHYPDVYSRLARPYQFDTDYSIIDGMYHLIHNPAAGMISSVDDLAAFDVALDQGRLMSEAARSEMFGSTVPTRPDRSDQTYGLGWYVQDFEGTQILWHAGRWPPSTSALYMKVPDHGLTFIVLANTDNLTVPFAGIGDGDVMRSAVALTFFRHMVFPELHGFQLPAIDWHAAGDELAQQLANVSGTAALDHIERELWAFRQAFASSGQATEADKLGVVGSHVFAGSSLRNDPSYVWLPGLPQVVAPIVSARTFSSASTLVVAWGILALVSASVVTALLALSRMKTPSEWAIWILAALLLGPFALAIYFVERRQRDEADSAIGNTVCASLFCITGYATAWALSIAMLLKGGDEPNPLAVIGALLLPFVVGLLLIRVPMLRRVESAGVWPTARRGLLAEVMAFAVGFVALFGVALYVDNQLFAFMPYPTSPYFWAMSSVGALVGFIGLTPLHYLMQRRGFSIWPAGGPPQSGALSLPTLRTAWWLLLLTLALSIGALLLTVGAFGG